MTLYLIRHADAVDAADDAARELSVRGREQVKALAAFLKPSGVFAPEEIWHSPLVRARETAALLVERLKLPAPLHETAGLLPEDNPATMAAKLRKIPRPLAVVGHEPHISALASLLVGGTAEPPVFHFRKCTILALEGNSTYWAVRWQVAPELLKT